MVREEIVKILLFGGSGQLGFEINKRAGALNFPIVSPIRAEVDITNALDIAATIALHKPEVIINCAAYTAVDKAEQETELAFKVNAEAPHAIAENAKKFGSYFIHISTDYVFSGKEKKAKIETDIADPVNVYGKSKLEGENAALGEYPQGTCVVRTSSLHGQRGINFVGTMLKLFKERPVVKVVTDQWMSPTWAGWLSEVLLDFVRIRPTGLYHASGSGAISWYEFAQGIMELASGEVTAKIEQTTAAEFGRPAQRPCYSVFDCSKLEKTLGRPVITWQDGVKGHLKDIGMLK